MSGGVAAILLAAGKSRRMGSCKQLLPLAGTTVIGRCLDTLVAAGIDEIVVVVSAEGHEVAQAARQYPLKVVINNSAEADMASSVRAGRDALSRGVSGTIVALCDYPLVTASSVDCLVRHHNEFPGRIVIPTHAGRRGHPVLFPHCVLDELTPELTLRDLTRRDPSRVLCVDVDDRGVLLDMDTPEDYRRICGAILQDDEFLLPRLLQADPLS